MGVLLYELLTGTTPFDAEMFKRAAIDEMRRIIREEQPPRPSTRLSSLGGSISTVSARRKADPRRLSPSLRGELDWVVMKTLEKDRSRRYETASALAADVRRHLDGIAVEACPPSAAYRFRKSLRKHRRTAWAAAVLLVALTIGIAGATLGFVRRDAARRRAVTAEAAAVTQAMIARRDRDEKEQARRDAVAYALALETQTRRAEAARHRTRQVLESLTDHVVTRLFSKNLKLGTPEKEYLRKRKGISRNSRKRTGNPIRPSATVLSASSEWRRFAWRSVRSGRRRKDFAVQKDWWRSLLTLPPRLSRIVSSWVGFAWT